MMLLKGLNVMNWLKRVNTIQTTDASNLVKKKLTMTQKIVKLKKEMLIVITVISTLLHKNLIIQRYDTFLQDYHKEIQQTKMKLMLL